METRAEAIELLETLAVRQRSKGNHAHMIVPRREELPVTFRLPFCARGRSCFIDVCFRRPGEWVAGLYLFERGAWTSRSASVASMEEAFDLLAKWRRG